MTPRLASSTTRNLRITRTICVLVVIGSALAIVAWNLTGAYAVTAWQYQLSTAAGLFGVILTLVLEDVPLLISSGLTLFVVAVALNADSVTNLELARAGGRYEPFIGNKLIALMVAVLAPAPVAAAYVIIAACALLPFVDYFVLLPLELRLNVAAPEPWGSLLYAILAGVVLAHRVRQTQAERELFLQQVVDESEAGSWMVDENLATVYVNPKMCQLLGYAPHEMLGKSPLDFMAGPSRNLAERRLTERAGRGREHYELRLNRRDGSPLWVQFAASPLRDDRGNYRGSFAFVTDLSAQKELQRKLQESENYLNSRQELLQGVLDNMTDGVFAVNADGKVRLANRTAQRVLGLKGEMDLPFSMYDAPRLYSIRGIDGKPLPPESLTVAQALKGRIVPPLITIMRTPGSDQDIYMQSSAAPFRDPTGPGFSAVVVLRDVTEAMNMDRMKDEFIRVAAHELKTPVSLVKLNSQLLPRALTSITLDSRQRSIIANLEVGAERIDHIASDLIDISQLQLGRIWLSMSSFDLAALAGSITADRQWHTQRHRLRMDFRETPVPVLADRQRIGQIIGILLDNALRYSPGGGDITVRVAAAGERATFSIADQGIGIPAEKKAQIFGRFFRAHTDTAHDYGGIGVGLYLSREIINRHGGEIGFESIEGQGSTFHFSLPLAGPTERKQHHG